MGLGLGVSLAQKASIQRLISLFLPQFKSLKALCSQERKHRDFAAEWVDVDFLVDKVVIKPRISCILFGAGIEDSSWSCPKNRTQTHGAGFAGGVDFTSLELEVIQIFAGFTDGDDFCVGGGVVGFQNHVGALTDDLSVFDDHTAKRSAIAG